MKRVATNVKVSSLADSPARIEYQKSAHWRIVARTARHTYRTPANDPALLVDFVVLINRPAPAFLVHTPYLGIRLWQASNLCRLANIQSSFAENWVVCFHAFDTSAYSRQTI